MKPFIPEFHFPIAGWKSAAGKKLSCRALLAASLLIFSAADGKAAQANFSPLSAAPLYFEADGNSFIARAPDCSVSLTPTEAALVLGKAAGPSETMDVQRAAFGRYGIRESRIPRLFIATRVVRLQFVGANPLAKMSGVGQLPGKANYLLGSEPSQWRTGVPLFSEVQANEIYPGIRTIYHADPAARLEYDFVLQPGADPKQISFRITGADKLSLDASGNLILKIGGDEIRQPKPAIFQEVNGARKEIAGGYRLTGDVASFWTADYDHNLPLTIDPTPTVGFMTYAGGSKLDIAWGIALDAGGNIYVAGETLSKDFSNPAAPGFTNGYAGGSSAFGDAFVAKYDNSGALQYLTYLGGRRDDGALGIAVDGAGDACITGFTDSTNFPLVNPIRNKITGPQNNARHIPLVDAFVAKLDPTGANLLFSTFVGGGGRDEGLGITLDAANNAYITGFTESTNGDFFPPPNGFQKVAGGKADAFAVKIPTDGTLAGYYATFVGGTNLDYGESVAVDSSGQAFITGLTMSTNFPITNVLGGTAYPVLNTETNHNFNKLYPRSDAFLSKFSADGSQLLFSSFIGGSNDEAGLHVAVDSIGSAYVTGYTFSTNSNFVPPVTALLSTTNRFTSRVFVVKLGTNNEFAYSTEFGDRYIASGTGIAVDLASNAYVTGFTTSSNFFGTNVFTDLRMTNSLGKVVKNKGRGGTNSVFIAVLGPSGAGFVPGKNVLVGGSGSDQPNGLAIDPAGAAAYIAGQTTSTNLATPGAAQTTLNLGKKKKSRIPDGFVGKIQF